MFGKIREDIEKFSEYGVSIDAEMLHEQIDTQLKQLKGNKALAQQMHKCYSIANQDCLEVLRLECGNEDYITYKKGNKTECLTFNQKYADFYTVTKRHKISNQDNLAVGWGKFFTKLDTLQLQEYQHKRQRYLNEKRHRMKEFEIAVLR